jgi:hypothetical protein
MKILCLTIILFSSLVICNAQNSTPEILTNKMVVELVKAKFSADTIIKKIRTASAVKFDTSTSALIELKNAGVEETIIQVMLDRASSNASVVSGNGPERVIGGDGLTRIEPSAKTTDSKEKEQPKKFSVTAQSFTFDLDWCKSSGDAIICEYTVTNRSDVNKDIGVGRNSPSTMVDEKGNPYRSSSNQIGMERDGMQPLSSNIPIRGKVVFEGIEKPLTVIKLLKLSVASFGPRTGGPVRILGNHWNYFNVEFRDIPLAQ